MDRRLVVTVIVTLAILLLGPGFSRSSGATEQKVAAKHSILASYSVRDLSGCVTTSVFISADTSSGSVPIDPAATSPGARVSLTRVDGCAKRTLLTAAGAVALTGDELEVREAAWQARLRVVIPATDVATGSAFEAKVDLSWKGIGAVQRASGSPAPPQANAPRIETRYREATLSGSVSDGTTAFAPGPSAIASMTTAVAEGNGSESRAATRSAANAAARRGVAASRYRQSPDRNGEVAALTVG